MLLAGKSDSRGRAIDLPDCSECDAAQTLSVVRTDARGYRECECSCCGKTVLLDTKNRVVHRPTR